MSRRRILHVDATSGASGDMILGALVDLGVPLAHIRRTLETLPLEGWRLSSRRITRAGLAARKVRVSISDTAHGRGWREIRRIVSGGDLEPAVRDRALGIFRRLIEAEADVHGVSPDKVHLHEVGAVDAIVDIVGACVGLARLAPDRIVVGAMTTGHGTVRCAHGVYPVPAPATLRLIRGVPVRGGESPGERLTPTGAAILTSVADAWGPLPPMTVEGFGSGAGDREFGDDPNFLRMILGTSMPAAVGVDASADDGVAVLQFNVDDAPPQVLAWAAERLFSEGALEVYTTPVQMKKGRSGHQMTVLAEPERLETLAEIILRETTTLGLRYRREQRIELQRSRSPVRTPFGTIRVKTGRLDDRVVQAWPEYDDCAAAARKHGVALKEVQQAALDAWRRSKSKSPARKGARRGGPRR